MITAIATAAARPRLAAAADWLGKRRGAALVVAGTREAARALIARAVDLHGPAIGLRPTTLDALARRLAAPELARRGLAPLSEGAWIALVARVTHRLARSGELGRFTPLADKPGLPSALASTLAELALADLGADVVAAVDVDLARLHAAVRAELPRGGLADRALVLEAATRAASEEAARAPALLALDPTLRSPLEADLLAALARRAPAALFTFPERDVRARARITERLGELAMVQAPAPTSPLAPLHTAIGSIDGTSSTPTLESALELFSAPGEARECAEIARRVLGAARQGALFDRMAVLLRAPELYRAHLAEAFRSAGIPIRWSRGTRRPDPNGRALLALLDCALEGLGARAFAEYLSLGVVPDAETSGAPPAALASGDRWAPEDPDAVLEDDEPEPASTVADDDAPVIAGTLRAPRRWERLLVEASVVGGRDRWERRLGGLEAELRAAIDATEEPDGNRARALHRDLAHLVALRDFALPLIGDLAALPREATWRTWIERLSALATRALRFPRRVLAVLASLAPMGDVGPVSLTEARTVLAARLRDESPPPEAPEEGAVTLCTIDEARGLDLDVVFLPGLAERVFPRKIVEDPILLDAKRAEISPDLETDAERGEAERMRLAIAVGAASQRLVVSYPRLDADRARPRVPSFYALEIARAARGALPSLGELAQEAERAGAARLGWPAPRDPAQAVSASEHDLALLASLAELPPEARRGRAHHIVDVSVHAGRALRARWSRWDPKKWRTSDGLVEDASGLAGAILAEHLPGVRAYSATGLESYAACPYRFYLRNVLRLEPRDGLTPQDELDPAQRGTLIHDVIFAFLTKLRGDGRLPIEPNALPDARATLDACLDEVAARHREELAPAIDRVWDAGIEAIRKDLREWVALAASEGDDERWVPAYFELAFGLSDAGRDAASRAEPIDLVLASGTKLRLRGSIDLVESRSGVLRATDHKTGSARVARGVIVNGGETLQPLLYALALEALLPDAKVEGGRLYYCTARGGFGDVEVPLDDEGRAAIAGVVDAAKGALESAFLPAYPADGACRFCDFALVCGPREEQRAARKPRGDARVQSLVKLRKAR